MFNNRGGMTVVEIDIKALGEFVVSQLVSQGEYNLKIVQFKETKDLEAGKLLKIEVRELKGAFTLYFTRAGTTYYTLRLTWINDNNEVELDSSEVHIKHLNLKTGYGAVKEVLDHTFVASKSIG